MGTTAQTRLDAETQKTLEGLVRDTGMTRSEVIREGIRLVKEQRQPTQRKRLIGVGCFDSGVTDLATNKKYMEGFGQINKRRQQASSEESSK